MASPSLAELTATTLDSRTGTLADNVLENIPLLYKLKQRGNVKPYSGGEYILQELTYAENSNVTAYTGYETLPIAAQDVISAAKYTPKHYSVAITYSRPEELANSGSERVIDLVAGRISNAESSLMNKINEDLITGDGTDSKLIDGLEYQVADSPATGSPGSINRATYTFWRNISVDATTDLSAAVSASNVESHINYVWMQVVRGTDSPDLLVMDSNYYGFLWAALQANQRFMKSDLADAGFKALQYAGADVIMAGGIGSVISANHCYMLNTKYLHYRPHKDQNFTRLGDKRESINQAASVVFLGWSGNLTASGLRFQGLLKD